MRRRNPTISQDVPRSLYDDPTFAPAERLPTMVTMLTKQSATRSIQAAPAERGQGEGENGAQAADAGKPNDDLHRRSMDLHTSEGRQS